MNKQTLWAIPLLILFLSGLSFLNARTGRQLPAAAPPAMLQSTGTPMIGPVTVTPDLITANTSTPVTVTAHILDTRLIPESLNLLRLNATGTSTVLGVMKDNGTDGDALANDKIFSLRLNLNQSTAGYVKLLVSAAFRNVLRRGNSPALLLAIVNNEYERFTVSDFPLTFLTPRRYRPDTFTPHIGEIVYFSDPLVSTAAGAYDAPVGCTIEFSAEPNPSSIPVAQWISDNIRGVVLSREPVIIRGREGIRITYSNDLIADRSTFILLPHNDLVYAFAAASDLCQDGLYSIVATATIP